MQNCPQCGDPSPTDARFCPRCGAPRVELRGDPLSGTVIAGRYLLLERIGHGSTGTIYRAEHTTLGRKVAVKLLHHQLSRDEQAVERFRREATTVGEIDNEHILQVLDFGRADDQRLFLAMELLEGETLAQVIKRERQLDFSRVIAILIQIGDALMEAHGLGYVHRDLRPGNIFLTERRGRKDFVKLLDFGLAKYIQPHVDQRQTALGMAFGDARYMSPEQARGDVIDRRTDIYALGVVAFEMLTSTTPFVGKTPFDILHQVLDEMAPSVRDSRPDCPAWLAAVVAQALSKRPEDRFVTILKLVECLKSESVPTATGLPLPHSSAAPATSTPQQTTAILSTRAAVRIAGEAKVRPQGAGPATKLVRAQPRSPKPAAATDGDTPSGQLEQLKRLLPPESRGSAGVAQSSGLDRGLGVDRLDAQQNAASGDHWFVDKYERSSSDDDGADETSKRGRSGLIIGGVTVGLIIVAISVLLLPRMRTKAVPRVETAELRTPPAETAAASTAIPPSLPAKALPPVASPRKEATTTPPGGAELLAEGGSAVAKSPRPLSERGAPSTERHSREGATERKEPHNAPPAPAASGGGREALVEPPPANPDALVQAEFFVKLGRQKLSAGDMAGAAINFNKAREFDPQSAEPFAGLGEVAFEQGDYHGAVVNLQEALRIASRARYLVLLGQAYYKLGRPRDAVTEYKKALKMEPDNKEAQHSLEIAERELPQGG